MRFRTLALPVLTTAFFAVRTSSQETREFPEDRIGMSIRLPHRESSDDPTGFLLRVPRSNGDVPLLADVPILGRLFTSHARRFPLDRVLPAVEGAVKPPHVFGPPKPLEPEAARPLSMFESWLETNLKKAVPGVGALTFLKTTTRRATSAAAEDATTNELEVADLDDAKALAVERFLAALALRRDTVLDVEICIVQLPAGTSPGGARGAVQTLASDAFERETASLKAQSGQAGKAVVLSCPRLMLQQSQLGRMTVVNQFSYVKDFEVRSSRGAVVADPVIDIVEEGLAVNVRGIVHEDGTTITLEMAASLGDLEKPIQKVDYEIAGTTVKVDRPVVRVSTWESGPVVLGAAASAFRVSELSHYDAEKKTEYDVDLLVRVAVKPPAPTAAEGRVMAADPASRLVVLEMPGPTSARGPGSVVEIRRKEAKIGTVRIDRVEGSLLVGHVTEGETPQPGDAAR